MTKWADFVVSAIKKGSGLANISHVQIHEDLEHGFGSPVLIDKYELSSKIQNGLSLVTVHKKNENEWAVGELIRTYVKDGEAYIRTDDNKVDGDNLGHMPTVDELDLVFKEIKKEEPKPIPTPKPTPPPEPEPEPVVEAPSPKINPNDGDFEYEDSKRKSLAEEAEKSRSNKSMPKGWSEKPTEKEIISDEIKEMKKKSKQNISREKEFSDYEQKYLEKFEKGKSKSDKLKEKLKQTEQEKHDARISRRMELEKASGKDYEKLLSEKPEPEKEPESEPVSKVVEKEIENEEKPSIENRISSVFKRAKSSASTSSKIADDTRNFIRKKRVAAKSESEPKPEPKLEPKPEGGGGPHGHDEKSKPKPKQPKENPNAVKENARREKLAKEALATRSNKTLPKGFGQESCLLYTSDAADE